MPAWDSARYDTYTWHFALDHLERHQTRALWIGLDETDDWAHAGRYDHYLHAAFDEMHSRFGSIEAYFTEGLRIDADDQNGCTNSCTVSICGNAGLHSGECEIHGKDGVAGSIPAGGSTPRLTSGNAGQLSFSGL